MFVSKHVTVRLGIKTQWLEISELFFRLEFSYLSSKHMVLRVNTAKAGMQIQLHGQYGLSTGFSAVEEFIEQLIEHEAF
jgi:hypothetical protein